MPADTTQLLTEARAGRQAAADELFARVYPDLRRVARRLMDQERPGHLLEPTAIVHDAYLRLVKQQPADWRDRAHFCAVAARAMRQALLDHARAARRVKRGRGREQVGLGSTLLAMGESTSLVDLESMDAALKRLAEIEPRAAEVVQMRFFGGLTTEEAAAVLGVSVSTAEREWRYARAWLRQRLGECPNTTGQGNQS